MNIAQVDDETFQAKILKLEGAQLDHALQLLQDEKVRYEQACKNYPPQRMESYAFRTALLDRLQARIDFVKERKHV